MKNYFAIIAIVIISCVGILHPQGFKVKAIGEQNFLFDGKSLGSQVSFFSNTPLEDVTGISNDIQGGASFNISDLKSLKGKIKVPVSSIMTGIETRDKHLQSAEWLNGDSYPNISFEILKVSDITSLADNKLNLKIVGNFEVHGIEKEVIANVTLTFLDENEQTKLKAPGDLLGVQAKFNIKLSDFGINNKLIGQKVAENVEVNVNIVGTNYLNK